MIMIEGLPGHRIRRRVFDLGRGRRWSSLLDGPIPQGQRQPGVTDQQEGIMPCTAPDHRRPVGHGAENRSRSAGGTGIPGCAV